MINQDSMEISWITSYNAGLVSPLKLQICFVSGSILWQEVVQH